VSLAQTWVTFVWHGTRHAVPAARVTAIVDRPALGPLPAPLRGVAAMLAYGGELCPVVSTPEAGEDASVLVCLGEDGNVALRVGNPIRVETADDDGAPPQFSEEPLPLLDVSQLIEVQPEESAPC